MRYVVPALVLVQALITLARYVGAGALAVIGVVMWEVWPWLLFITGYLVGATIGR